MTCGVILSASAREREPLVGARVAGPRALLGRAGASAGRRGRSAAGRSAGPSQIEGREVGPSLILFFFLKNVNSTDICLFH
jgi:hypothetical protein